MDFLPLAYAGGDFGDTCQYWMSSSHDSASSDTSVQAKVQSKYWAPGSGLQTPTTFHCTSSSASSDDCVSSSPETIVWENEQSPGAALLSEASTAAHGKKRRMNGWETFPSGATEVLISFFLRKKFPSRAGKCQLILKTVCVWIHAQQ